MSNFPGALDNDASLYVAKDNISTQLNAKMEAGDNVAVVKSSAGWAVNMIASCESEQMLVTAVNGNNVTVTRAFGGTVAAAHNAGKTFSNNVDAAYHEASKSSIIAIETALGANLSNVASSPLISSAAYNFGAQTPGGTLNPGANAIVLNPMPAGITAASVNTSYLYISGGTGTPEAVPIIGWSANTVTVTCANAHSGAWTIKSASAGIQEAAIANPGRTVFVPAGTYYIYGKVTLKNVGLRGDGPSQTKIVSMFGNDNLFYVITDGSPTLPEISSLRISTDASVSTTTSAYWYIYAYQTGPFIHHLDLRGGRNHIMLDSCPVSWISSIDQGDHTIGIQVGNGPGKGSAAMISSVIASSATVGATWLYGRTGNAYVTNINSQLSAVTGSAYHILISPSGATDGFGESQFVGLELDGGTGPSIYFNPAGGAQCYGFQFADIMMTGGDNPGHQAIVANSGTVGAEFRNIQTRGLGPALGSVIALGAVGAFTFDGLVIEDLLAANVTGLTTNAAVAGLSLRNSRIGYLSTGAPDANLLGGVNFGSFASTAVDLIGNRINASSGAVAYVPANVSTWKVSGNYGLSSASVASGAALAFPLVEDGGTITVTGNTGITSVSGLRAGQTGYILTPSAVTFTAGATIGTTVTTTANTLTPFFFDGTKLWLR